MIHYTCDMCGKSLLVDEDVRYEVKIEVEAAYDPLEITEEDLEGDPLEEIEELLDEIEEMDPEELEDQVYKTFRFDLCAKCQKIFIKDPLFKYRKSRFDFFNN